MESCPKCGGSIPQGSKECPHCGIFIRKYLSKQQTAEQEQRETDIVRQENASLDMLHETSSLFISQQKEWAEIITNYETHNRYIVFGQGGQELFYAAETGTGFLEILSRNFLKYLRPFNIVVASLNNEVLFEIKRPFRFYFHEAEIFGEDGTKIGSIKREFDLLRRKYAVFDRHGRKLYKLFGPILHPWTFEIQQHNQTLGKITKKWSGLMQESISDADKFGIQFPQSSSLDEKTILLGAVFLIDFVHFESRN